MKERSRSFVSGLLKQGYNIKKPLHNIFEEIKTECTIQYTFSRQGWIMYAFDFYVIDSDIKYCALKFIHTLCKKKYAEIKNGKLFFF